LKTDEKRFIISTLGNKISFFLNSEKGFSVINNISAGFIETFINFHGKNKLTAAEMFKRLSLEMGGDGQTITKKQLNDYIDKADSGSIKLSKQKLSALKEIRNEWDTISDGKDSISVGNFKGFELLLAAAMVDSPETEKDDSSNSKNSKEDSNSLESDLQALLLKNLGLTDLKDASNSDLSTHLNTLLSNDSNDDDIADAIDSLINLKANRINTSTVEVKG